MVAATHAVPARAPRTRWRRGSPGRRHLSRQRARSHSAARRAMRPCVAPARPARRRAARRSRARHGHASSPALQARCGDSVRAALLIGLPAAQAFDADDVDDALRRRRRDAGRGRRADGRDPRGAVDAASQDERAAQAERLRKMLLAMVEDIRVVLIKLAERTQAMRYLVAGGAQRSDGRAARRARGAGPLRAARQPARRLAAQVGARGPGAPRARARDLQGDRADARRAPRRPRALHRRRSSASCARELAAAGIAAEVTGRPKHIYSIWNKMRRKGVGIEALYDIRARAHPGRRRRRTATRRSASSTTCGRRLPGEFDDYIAKPKANNYRSLHTAVIGPDGKPLEVQIRTLDMHQHSEYGVAAHWRYKEGAREGRAPRSRVRGPHRLAAPGARLEGRGRRRIGLAHRVQEQPLHRHDLRADAAGQGGRPAARRDAGRLRLRRAHEPRPPLPRRARRRCDGAAQLRAEERPAGRDHRGEAGRPVARLAQSRARLRARAIARAPRCASGSRRSSRRRRSRTAARGRARACPRRARPRSISTPSRRRPASTRRTISSPPWARDEVNTRQLQTAIKAVVQPAAPEAARRAEIGVLRQSKAAGAGSGILVVGVDRLMTGLARCCKPAPPDRIVGFVTRGKGVTIHRAELHQRRADARARARAPDHRRLGRAARRGVSGRRRARGDRPPGPAARRHRSAFRARRSTSPPPRR